MNNSLISKRLYDRESKDWGSYKVINFIEYRGKSKIPYYEVKFKNSGNIIEAPEKTILENRVIDIEAQKKQTKKNARQKKKESKKAKYQAKRFILNFNESPTLLSLDISTHSTGYAIFKNGDLIKYGYIYQPKSEKWDTRRINYMYSKILDLIEEYDVNCVAMEDIIFKHKISLHVLSKIQGVICNKLFEEGIRYLLITPIEWKSAYDINRDSTYKGKNSREQSKLKTVACVNKDFGLNLEKEFYDSPKDLSEPCYFDIADAIAIGYITIKDRIQY